MFQLKCYKLEDRRVTVCEYSKKMTAHLEFCTQQKYPSKWKWYDAKSTKNERKIGKLNFTKIKSFYASKTIEKMKRQSIDWENVFANHVSDKGLIPEYIWDSYSSKKKTTQLKNGQRIWIDISS